MTDMYAVADELSSRATQAEERADKAEAARDDLAVRLTGALTLLERLDVTHYYAAEIEAGRAAVARKGAPPTASVSVGREPDGTEKPGGMFSFADITKRAEDAKRALSAQRSSDGALAKPTSDDVLRLHQQIAERAVTFSSHGHTVRVVNTADLNAIDRIVEAIRGEQRVDNPKVTVPWCEEHGKGAYGQCLACACRRMGLCLSQIAEMFDPTNEPYDGSVLNAYDIDCDEEALVARIKAARERATDYPLPVHDLPALLRILEREPLEVSGGAVTARISAHTLACLTDVVRALVRRTDSPMSALTSSVSEPRSAVHDGPSDHSRSRELAVGDEVRLRATGKIIGWTGAATAPGARWADVKWSDSDRHFETHHEKELILAGASVHCEDPSKASSR